MIISLRLRHMGSETNAGCLGVIRQINYPYWKGIWWLSTRILLNHHHSRKWCSLFLGGLTGSWLQCHDFSESLPTFGLSFQVLSWSQCERDMAYSGENEIHEKILGENEIPLGKLPVDPIASWKRRCLGKGIWNIPRIELYDIQMILRFITWIT